MEVMDTRSTSASSFRKLGTDYNYSYNYSYLYPDPPYSYRTFFGERIHTVYAV